MGTADISDLLLTCLVMGAFGLAFIVGLFNLGRVAGIAFIGLSGGFSVGVRIVLFRDGLLVPTYFVKWVICLVLGLAYFVLVVARQRIGIVRINICILNNVAKFIAIFRSFRLSLPGRS